MTLILGLHLPRKLYLSFDTRVTFYNNGKKDYEDNLIKLFVLNKRISGVCAGNAHFANYVILKLKEKMRSQSSIDFVKYTINNEIENIAKNYVNETGFLNKKIALIISGYNLLRKKKINSSKLGVILAGEAKTMEGKMIKQSIPNSILNPLISAVIKHNGLKKDDYIKTELDETKIYGLELEVNNEGVKYSIEEVECCDYIIYHPKQGLIKIQVPDHLLSVIEFRQLRDNQTGQDVFIEDSIYLYTFIAEQIKKHNLENVGGSIITSWVTIEGTIFPTTKIMRYHNGKIEEINQSIISKSEKLFYRNKNGNLESCKFIQNYNKLTEHCSL